jgi:hypothetical protein
MCHGPSARWHRLSTELQSIVRPGGEDTRIVDKSGAVLWDEIPPDGTMNRPEVKQRQSSYQGHTSISNPHVLQSPTKAQPLRGRGQRWMSASASAQARRLKRGPTPVYALCTGSKDSSELSLSPFGPGKSVYTTIDCIS